MSAEKLSFLIARYIEIKQEEHEGCKCAFCILAEIEKEGNKIIDV